MFFGGFNDSVLQGQSQYYYVPFNVLAGHGITRDGLVLLGERYGNQVINLILLYFARNLLLDGYNGFSSAILELHSHLLVIFGSLNYSFISFLFPFSLGSGCSNINI